MHIALPKWPINQFSKAYRPNIYTVICSVVYCNKQRYIVSRSSLGTTHKKSFLWYCIIMFLYSCPSLKTQSCIKGLLVARDFCFLGRLGCRASAEKTSGPIMSNFWGRVFHVFRGKKNVQIFLKFCSVRSKKLHKMMFKKKKKKS